MANTKEAAKKPTHVVKTEFRDINNFDLIHEVGKDVSDFAPERLAVLVENGHVEQVVDNEAIEAAQKAEADKKAAEEKKAADDAKKAEADAKKAADNAAKADAEAAKKAAEAAEKASQAPPAA